MTEEANDTDLKLIQVLIDQKLISAAQAELAKSDGEVSGMTLAEVLLARRWVDEKILERVAPWLKDTPIVAPGVVPSPESNENTDQTENTYQQNLKRYRQLMHKILDE